MAEIISLLDKGLWNDDDLKNRVQIAIIYCNIYTLAEIDLDEGLKRTIRYFEKKL